MSEPHWAIACHSYTHNPNTRVKRWYRISRLVYADNAWFELYWHPDASLRGNNAKVLWRKAKAAGIDLIPGVYGDAPAPRNGSKMERMI